MSPTSSKPRQLPNQRSRSLKTNLAQLAQQQGAESPTKRIFSVFVPQKHPLVVDTQESSSEQPMIDPAALLHTEDELESRPPNGKDGPSPDRLEIRRLTKELEKHQALCEELRKENQTLRALIVSNSEHTLWPDIGKAISKCQNRQLSSHQDISYNITDGLGALSLQSEQANLDGPLQELMILKHDLAQVGLMLVDAIVHDTNRKQWLECIGHHHMHDENAASVLVFSEKIIGNALARISYVESLIPTHQLGCGSKPSYTINLADPRWKEHPMIVKYIAESLESLKVTMPDISNPEWKNHPEVKSYLTQELNLMRKTLVDLTDPHWKKNSVIQEHVASNVKKCRQGWVYIKILDWEGHPRLNAAVKQILASNSYLKISGTAWKKNPVIAAYIADRVFKAQQYALKILPRDWQTRVEVLEFVSKAKQDLMDELLPMWELGYDIQKFWTEKQGFPQPQRRRKPFRNPLTEAA